LFSIINIDNSFSSFKVYWLTNDNSATKSALSDVTNSMLDNTTNLPISISSICALTILAALCSDMLLLSSSGNVMILDSLTLNLYMFVKLSRRVATVRISGESILIIFDSLILGVNNGSKLTSSPLNGLFSIDYFWMISSYFITTELSVNN